MNFGEPGFCIVIARRTAIVTQLNATTVAIHATINQAHEIIGCAKIQHETHVFLIDYAIFFPAFSMVPHCAPSPSLHGPPWPHLDAMELHHLSEMMQWSLCGHAQQLSGEFVYRKAGNAWACYPSVEFKSKPHSFKGIAYRNSWPLS